MEIVPEKKKRGRKAKIVSEIIENNENNEPIIKFPKKRGRKPKGGKVVAYQPNSEPTSNSKINIILHLKCNTNDLKNNDLNDCLLENYQFSESKLNDLNFTTYNNTPENPENSENPENPEEENLENPKTFHQIQMLYHYHLSL